MGKGAAVVEERLGGRVSGWAGLRPARWRCRQQAGRGDTSRLPTRCEVPRRVLRSTSAVAPQRTSGSPPARSSLSGANFRPRQMKRIGRGQARRQECDASHPTQAARGSRRYHPGRPQCLPRRTAPGMARAFVWSICQAPYPISVAEMHVGQLDHLTCEPARGRFCVGCGGTRQLTYYAPYSGRPPSSGLWGPPTHKPASVSSPR